MSYLDRFFSGISRVLSAGGTALPAQTTINFTGAGVSVTDNPGQQRTDVTFTDRIINAETGSASANSAAFARASAELWRGGSISPFFGPLAGRTLLIPAGIYYIDEELFFRSSTGLHIMGEGPQATIIKWVGGGAGPSGTTTPGTFPMLRINACQFCTIENLALWGNASNKPSEMIFFDYTTDPSGMDTFLSTNNKITNVICTGQSGFKEYEIGLRFSGARNNNDIGTFTGCTWECYAETGISLEGTQQKNHTFINCNTNGCWDGVLGHDGGKSSIDTSRGTGPNAGAGGSFMWIAGASGHNTVAGFVLGAPNDPIEIRGVNCEGNYRFVDNDVAGAGPNGAGARVIIVEGCRDDVSPFDYAPDRIRLRGPGSYAVNRNHFLGRTASLPYVLFEGIPAGRYQARGNMFMTEGSFRAKGIITNSGQPSDWDVGDNLYVDDAGGVISSMEWLDSNNEAPYIPISGVSLTRPDYKGHAGKPGIRVQASAFTAAALTQSVKVWDLPRGTRIKRAYLYNFQIPVGPSLSAAHVKIGSTSGGDEFLLSADILGASGHLYGAVTGDLGVNFTGASFAQGAYMGDYENTTSIYATITTVGCNLSALTNGYFFLWLELDVLQRFVF